MLNVATSFFVAAIFLLGCSKEIEMKSAGEILQEAKNLGKELEMVTSASDVEFQVRDLNKFIQDDCIEKKSHPSLSRVQSYLKKNKTANATKEQEIEFTDYHDIVISRIEVKYIANEFECQGVMDVAIPRLKFKRTFTLPIPHPVDTPQGYWKMGLE